MNRLDDFFYLFCENQRETISVRGKNIFLIFIKK